VAERVAEVQERALAGLALVGRDDLRLDPAALVDRVRERLVVARDERGHAPLEPREEGVVADRAVLDDLRQSRGELARRKRREAGGVDGDGRRLVERADHVLAEAMVDRRLPADRRVHLREKRRGHLHAGDAALVDRGREAGEVADDAAAERDDRRRPVDPELEQPRQHVVQRVPALVRLAVGDEHDVRRDARALEARAERRQVMRGDRRVGDDHGARGDRRHELAHAGERAAADADRIGALAKRDPELPHRASSAARRAGGSNPRAKRITSSRSDVTTWSAIDRYRWSRCA